jgi:hypothetical protein
VSTHSLRTKFSYIDLQRGRYDSLALVWTGWPSPVRPFTAWCSGRRHAGRNSKESAMPFGLGDAVVTFIGFPAVALATSGMTTVVGRRFLGAKPVQSGAMTKAWTSNRSPPPPPPLARRFVFCSFDIVLLCCREYVVNSFAFMAVGVSAAAYIYHRVLVYLKLYPCTPRSRIQLLDRVRSTVLLVVRQSEPSCLQGLVGVFGTLGVNAMQSIPATDDGRDED